MLGQRDRWRFSERWDASVQSGLHPGYNRSVYAVYAACFSLSYVDRYLRSLCAFLGNHTLSFYLSLISSHSFRPLSPSPPLVYSILCISAFRHFSSSMPPD